MFQKDVSIIFYLSIMIDREEYLFGIEEKFLAATELVDCRDYPAAKIVLQEILDEEPGYARAHYDLARIYEYGLYDLAKAAYHIRLCCELDPAFVPAYYLYLDILLKQRDYENAERVIKRAWDIPGICRSCIANRAGTFEEAQQNYAKAESCYRNAFLHSLNSCCTDDFEKNIERIRKKQQLNRRFNYTK
jgi:tetratricopeptide (TPR) repeat protein